MPDDCPLMCPPDKFPTPTLTCPTPICPTPIASTGSKNNLGIGVGVTAFGLAGRFSLCKSIFQYPSCLRGCEVVSVALIGTGTGIMGF